MSTATKGISNLYGNPSHMPTEKINFPYATKFPREDITKDHVSRHHGRLGIGKHDHALYESKARSFANKVDPINHESFVDENGRTHKYSRITHEYVAVDPDGTIVTYFIPRKPDNYWRNLKRRKGIKK